MLIYFLLYFLPLFSICPTHKQLENQGLVDVQKVNPAIRVRLIYSEKQNFMGFDLYGCLEKAYLQKPAAEKLDMAQRLLEKEKPGFHLLVWDAARPGWAQKILWDSIKKPEKIKHVYVADPKRGSIHNYGCAVDLSICDSRGAELDMGTAFDFFGDLAQPRLEKKLQREGKLSSTQISNRLLLRKVMKKAGFLPITSEWWHFNHCSLAKAKSLYRLVK